MTDKIGILVSGGYGAGWSTWNESECALDQELAQAFEDKLTESEIMAIAEKNWPMSYKGGLMQCEVIWVNKGTQFRITEYDGYESIEFNTDDSWNIA